MEVNSVEVDRGFDADAAPYEVTLGSVEDDRSLFVSSEQELEERRRRARERAEQRRLDDTEIVRPELNPPFHQGLDDHEE